MEQTKMFTSKMLFLSAFTCFTLLLHQTSGQNCSDHCKTCGVPEINQCIQCHSGFILYDNLCVDVDECAEEVLACSGISFICVNTEGSFHCKCADGYAPKDGLCERVQSTVLCTLATLAAKGDMVFTSIFMGALAAGAGYWLSNKTERLLDGLLKNR
ncbi:hypothetical protein DNTS_011633 [Danionella cerebrum]|uniref:EGF-like domain-containing protein n=1 Tax=Danionella cerebrum TaxID=2873325 RepID=A0A553NMN7_9TELE|nr:hypothetical protein DNTS_011633 [Danionella translucida]